MKIKEIIKEIEIIAPPLLQESYDNTGIQIGQSEQKASGVLLCIDITEEVIEEAIQKKCNLIISHHPLLFKGLKSITGKNYIERCIIKACKNDVTLYSSHTSLDNAWNGVNFKIAKKLGLINTKILEEKENLLEKVVVFAPKAHAENIRSAIFEAGGGHIGNYDACSYNSDGTGTFRAGKEANPYCGDIGEYHSEKEVRIEVIFPIYLKKNIQQVILSSHPYEEPAYDFYPLKNKWDCAGSGTIGEFPEAMDEKDFLTLLKDIFGIPVIKHSPFTGKDIKKVALCGGSGSFLMPTAKNKQADAFLTGDIKYHDYFGLENSILIADIGHFESEQFTKEIFYEVITKKFPNFAVHFSNVITNPINYF
ncbi:MAG: Nif3-like dinuclear metal center hexameric protein [Candidatus Azobacteroides sp.]|nr:Nif3-like dinuclear metal center hexameric protein [Candidatus Azobacteroides sp.]